MRCTRPSDLNGQVYKVDGHTRSLLWMTGALPDPEFVFATVYRCKTREELNALYATFRSERAGLQGRWSYALAALDDWRVARSRICLCDGVSLQDSRRTQCAVRDLQI